MGYEYSRESMMSPTETSTVSAGVLGRLLLRLRLRLMPSAETVRRRDRPVEQWRLKSRKRRWTESAGAAESIWIPKFFEASRILAFRSISCGDRDRMAAETMLRHFENIAIGHFLPLETLKALPTADLKCAITRARLSGIFNTSQMFQLH